MLKSGGTAKATGLCNTFLPKPDIAECDCDVRNVPHSRKNEADDRAALVTACTPKFGVELTVRR